MIRDRVDPVAIAGPREICVRDDVVLANVREKWISLFAVIHEPFEKSFC